MGHQYLDLDGHTNAVGGRPDERHGFQGGWTHGVTVFCGGVPHDVRPPKETTNHGTVLFTSASLRPNLEDELRIKSCSDGEREGRSGSQAHWTHPAHDDVQLDELNHGTILATFPHLRPDLSYEGRTNAAGGRATERLGARGSFTPGRAIRAGGPARDVPVPAPILNRGTVLFTLATLACDAAAAAAPALKPGTTDERVGRAGSFEHGDAHLRMPTAADAALWREDGQRGGRRYAGGHWLAGASVMAGGAPVYAA
ncbi:hypothetical protein JKP88DRAFT_292005 [Tribonema minus]|uniref:Uncharacterized protein n=1 Tax=Tribonema minus TaxID=303371 RepID=A0A836CPV2_9STRA|nr:hypothetical protein JKP88DRAFT_292005 [Tribonema minus]